MSNPKYIAADAETVKAQIALLLSAYPDVEDDAELLADMLEGETNLNGLLERIMSIKFNDEDMDAALELRGKAIQARRERYRARADAMKDLALSLMQAAKLDKIELTECTLSIRKPNKRVEISDADALPQGYYRTDKIADKKAIADSFKAGESIPGASYVDGSEGLTVKRS